jgi:hypothetical protein
MIDVSDLSTRTVHLRSRFLVLADQDDQVVYFPVPGPEGVKTSRGAAASPLVPAHQHMHAARPVSHQCLCPLLPPCRNPGRGFLHMSSR